LQNYTLRNGKEKLKTNYPKRDGYMMTAKKEFMYWRTNKEWYKINSEKDCFELTDKAPERARKSFELYQKLQKRRQM